MKHRDSLQWTRRPPRVCLFFLGKSVKHPAGLGPQGKSICPPISARSLGFEPGICRPGKINGLRGHAKSIPFIRFHPARPKDSREPGSRRLPQVRSPPPAGSARSVGEYTPGHNDLAGTGLCCRHNGFGAWEDLLLNQGILPGTQQDGQVEASASAALFHDER